MVMRLTPNQTLVLAQANIDVRKLADFNAFVVGSRLKSSAENGKCVVRAINRVSMLG
jgi:hypothetical protein